MQNTIPATGNKKALPEKLALLINQTSLNRKNGGRQPVSYLNYDINEGRLSVAINAWDVCAVEICVHQVKFFGKNKDQIIYHRQLPPGKHTLNFDENVLTGFGTNFLGISINKKPWFIQRI
jgi:hypothetical protein